MPSALQFLYKVKSSNVSSSASVTSIPCLFSVSTIEGAMTGAMTMSAMISGVRRDG